jgi:hypothetical protein
MEGDYVRAARLWKQMTSRRHGMDAPPGGLGGPPVGTGGRGNKFIERALSNATQAIQEDNSGNYERAVGLYKQTILDFTAGANHEKGEALQNALWRRANSYWPRLQELRELLIARQEAVPSAATMFVQPPGGQVYSGTLTGPSRR